MHVFFLTAFQVIAPLISIGISPINELSVQSINVPIQIPTYPATVTSQSSYAITTNENCKKIIGSLDLELPTNLRVSLSLQAPSKAQSEGPIPLSLTGKTLVSNISRVAQSDLTITYTFSAVGPIVSGTYSKVVRLTLVD